MTEEQARLLCCPVGKMRASFDANWDKGFCIASKCMAWMPLTRTVQVDSRGERLKAGAVYIRTDIKSKTIDDGGYCGMIGEPLRHAAPRSE